MNRPQTLDLLEQLILKANGCPQFASFTYTAEPSGNRLTAERARHVILLGASMEALYEKDIDVIRDLLPTLTDSLDVEAAHALLESREESLRKGIGNNSAATSADAYIQLDCPGLKVHVPTGNVHVMGTKISKVVLIKGTYRPVNSKPLTVAKDRIREQLPSSMLRQFNLGNETVIRIQGQTLVFG